MALESFAKALHKETSMSKRKIMSMDGVITQILQATCSQIQEAITFYNFSCCCLFSVLMSLVPLTFHRICRFVYQANRDDHHRVPVRSEGILQVLLIQQE